MGDLTKNFNKAEFACKCGCGADHINRHLVEIVQEIRDDLNMPLSISSGVRCVKHNAEVVGKKDSAHVSGLAVDIAIKNGHEGFVIMKAAIARGVRRVGVAKTFIHLDIDVALPQEWLWIY